MATYNVSGWVWAGFGVTTLSPVTITDNDANLSPYFTNDFTETITIGGSTYINPRAGTYQLSFNDSGGTPHTEDLLLFYTGSNFIFVPLPGSNFDSGSTITALGGWQNWTTGFTWSSVTCFAGSTLIATPSGMVAVKALQPGDLVVTRDNGLQMVRWIGRTHVDIDRARPQEREALFPVRIARNALGPGTPTRDLLVSRQHRILLQSKIARRMFGNDLLLVPAIKLTGQDGIRLDRSVRRITYFHVLLDHHEVLNAQGVPAESLYLGRETLMTLAREDLDELALLFPDLSTVPDAPPSCYVMPANRPLKRFMHRHEKNGHALRAASADVAQDDLTGNARVVALKA